MKIAEILAKLYAADNSIDYTIGQIVDLLMDKEVAAPVKKNRTEITEADLDDPNGFDPNDHLTDAEELYKQEEKRESMMKSKDIMKTFEDLRLQGTDELINEFTDANEMLCVHEMEIVGLLALYDYLYDVHVVHHGEPSEEWKIEHLNFILAQKRFAYSYHNS